MVSICYQKETSRDDGLLSKKTDPQSIGQPCQEKQKIKIKLNFKKNKNRTE